MPKKRLFARSTVECRRQYSYVKVARAIPVIYRATPDSFLRSQCYFDFELLFSSRSMEGDERRTVLGYQPGTLTLSCFAPSVPDFQQYNFDIGSIPNIKFACRS